MNTSEKPKVVLTIAGFDPSSGAGITADLLTISAHGCFGLSAVTSITVQTTEGVFGADPVVPETLKSTIFSLKKDFEISAVKVGMLGFGSSAAVVADFLEGFGGPIVVDPVTRSSSGRRLIDDDGLRLLRQRLLRQATVITPNIPEAQALSMLSSGPVSYLADMLKGFGARNVVITGGDQDPPTDVLFTQGGGVHRYTGERIPSRATHGTGCAFSTALACRLAMGSSLEEAVGQAKDFVRQAILSAPGLGHGKGPMNLLWPLQKREAESR